ncbi:MAG: hypothetical protein MZV64_00330 [Ignavibacteriales bacterium]|nr:hypothetical protein [Ignavibacteriales bacterium]
MFGSYVRDEQKKDGDLDIPGHIKGRAKLV